MRIHHFQVGHEFLFLGFTWYIHWGCFDGSGGGGLFSNLPLSQARDIKLGKGGICFLFFSLLNMYIITCKPTCLVLRSMNVLQTAKGFFSFSEKCPYQFLSVYGVAHWCRTHMLFVFPVLFFFVFFVGFQNDDEAPLYSYVLGMIHPTTHGV